MSKSGMSDANNHEKIRELTWRDDLSPAQQQELKGWLAAHPEAAETFALDAEITAALAKLPDAPVSSNFTARVLEQAQLERQAADRRTTQKSFIFRWRWLIRSH